MKAAPLNHLVNFGFFTGITILIALAADFLLLPAIMVFMNRNIEGIPRGFRP